MCGPRGLAGEPDYLFHNNGDGTFTDVSEKAGVSDKRHYFGFSSTFVDINNDGKVDLIVANDSTPNYLYINKGDGTFQDASFFSGFALNQEARETASMGLAVGDYLNNGLVDLYTTTFPNAKYCGHCHQEALHQWRQALHSNSFRTPFYRTTVNILIRTKGIEFSRHCDSCHNPVAVLAGGLTQDSQVDRSFDKDGLTCTTCHSIQSLKSINGNGGFVMGIPAVMVDEKGNRIPGEVPYDEIMKYPKRHSMAVMKSIYRTPEFCASCHKANLPDTLNDYKFIRAFTTYDEWQQSKFSQRNPLTFYTADFTTCQGCHMKRAANTLPDPGAKNGTFASHSWPAGNTAVPFYYGFDEQLRKTTDYEYRLDRNSVGEIRFCPRQHTARLGSEPEQRARLVLPCAAGKTGRRLRVGNRQFEKSSRAIPCITRCSPRSWPRLLPAARLPRGENAV